MRAALAARLVARAARVAPGRARVGDARCRRAAIARATRGAAALAEALARHESRAARLSRAEEARVILDTNGCGRARRRWETERAGVLAGFPCGARRGVRER